jgi:hypothetical protein
MIKAEIITAHTRYTFAIPAECYGGSESVAEAYEWLEKQIHPSGFIELPGRIIDIDPKDVKGVDVWQEEMPNPLDHLTMQHPAPEIKGPLTEPWPVLQPVSFLGRQIAFEGLAYELNGQLFIMPQQLAGRAPLDAMSEENLRALMKANFPDAEAVIPPPVTLTAAEAVAFLMDYAESAAPELPVSGEINARAAGAVFE